MSDEHFSVGGTLVMAWDSMKSFQPKAEDAPSKDEGPGDPPRHDIAIDQLVQTQPQLEPKTMPCTTHQHRNAEVDFRGEKRSNTILSRPLIMRPGFTRNLQASGRCFMGHAVMENRSGLIVHGDLTRADGRAE